MEFKDSQSVLQPRCPLSSYSDLIVAASALWHRVEPNSTTNHQREKNRAEIDSVFSMEDPYDMMYTKFWEASLGLENDADI